MSRRCVAQYRRGGWLRWVDPISGEEITTTAATTSEAAATAHKWFDGDVVAFPGRDVLLEPSPVRCGLLFPAVLVLEGNCTFGRTTKGKLLYRCLPDNLAYPVFLVPYEIKTLGFFKVLTNLFVLIQLDHWHDKHPVAKLHQVFGPVDDLASFAEYQLACKQLAVSLHPLSKTVVQRLKSMSAVDVWMQRLALPDLSGKVFSIDPADCQDFDDAFSVREDLLDIFTVTVHIANVAKVLDALQVWPQLTSRPATIYLPHTKVPMLPTVLSEQVCSLRQDTWSSTLAMDVTVRAGQIIATEFRSTVIQVAKNFVYDSDALLASREYQKLRKVTEQLSPQAAINSHEVVAFWMVLYNQKVADALAAHGVGVFRSCRQLQCPDDLDAAAVSPELHQFFRVWRNTTAQYVRDVPAPHDVLQLDAYAHASSPIRRLPDLLNQLLLLLHVLKDPTISPEARTFLTTQLNRLDHINRDLRQIRRVQQDCALLHACTAHLDQPLKCAVFDRQPWPKEKGWFRYQVYVPALQLCGVWVSTICLEKSVDEDHRCRLFVFQDEERLKRKIRIQVLVQE